MFTKRACCASIRPRRVALLGWKPALRLNTALEWIVDWHKAIARGEDARAVTRCQIAEYQALCAAVSNRAAA